MTYYALRAFILTVAMFQCAHSICATELNGGDLAPHSTSISGENCGGRLVYVDDPSEVGDNYPIFMRTRRAIYVMRNENNSNCFHLSGNEFRGSITFFILSRAPEGFNGDLGVLMAKSVRTFRPPVQDSKIALSRNAGWYLPSANKKDTMAIVDPLDDYPISTTISDWNSLYIHPKAPELFGGLGVQWHAYASDDKTIYSTLWPQFWILNDPGDFDNKVVTDYLLRYTINPDKSSQTPVPFYVNTPSNLDRFDLAIYSNVGFEAQYTFIFK